MSEPKHRSHSLAAKGYRDSSGAQQHQGQKCDAVGEIKDVMQIWLHGIVSAVQMQSLCLEDEWMIVLLASVLLHIDFDYSKFLWVCKEQ